MPAEDLSVSYSVRDLIDSLRAELRADLTALRGDLKDQHRAVEERLDRMERAFQHLADGKADKADVAALALQVQALEEDKRLREKQERLDRERRRGGVEWRRWLVPVLIAVADLAVMVVQLARGGGVHG